MSSSRSVTSRLEILWTVFVASLAAALPAVPAAAQLAVSPDVTVSLSGLPHADEAVPFLSNPATQLDLGPLPVEAAVSAVCRTGTGEVLFSLETTLELAGSLAVEPRDVVRYDGSGYSLELDGSSSLISADAHIDAISCGDDLLLSFDTTLALPGHVVAADEDLVEWDGTSFVSPPFFDGSVVGVPDALDLDGAQLLAAGQLLLSFDVTSSIRGVAFDDEDVVEYDPGGATWTLFADASSLEPALADADTDGVALPEPRSLPSLASGWFLLMVLGRIRKRKPRPAS